MIFGSLGKTLARECALGPAWTGSGLKKIHGLDDTSTEGAFKESSRIDFTEVAVHHQGVDSVGTAFTVSNCGRFLMAATGCLVYVYELNWSTTSGLAQSYRSPGCLRPIKTVICPHRVLACSMDTSSNRYAVAILLEGRMGLVCDITALDQQSNRASQNNRSRSGHQESSRGKGKKLSWHEGLRGVSYLDRVCLNSSASVFNGGITPTKPPFVFPGIAAAGSNFAPANDSNWQDVIQDDFCSSSQSVGLSSRHSSFPLAEQPRHNSALKSLLPAYRESELGELAMPIETGPRSLYRNLCSSDDPPRSVAICPQRRCVAFGCSSGIELHWVDALTGQDLNRWFPLTAPSDYLFFLPPRRNVDSSKKLRLISNAARPSEQSALAERAFSRRHRNNFSWERVGRATSIAGSSQNDSDRQPVATRISGNASAGRTGFGRTELSDHYRAVPISDGYHILFTDPVTGLLCLGNDAPVGGPTKLLRKIWFRGPKKLGSPIVYASGSDLNWGVRVVAVFGNEEDQSAWLFSVPSDIFTADANLNQSGQPLCSRLSISEGIQNRDWLDWWPENGVHGCLKDSQDPVPRLHPRDTWPVEVGGQEIGKCYGVTDLAIDSGRAMTIWAFSKTGIAKVWTMNDGKHDEPTISLVVRDGTIRNVDTMGDVEMLDVIPSPDNLESHFTIPETFDGSSSLHSSLFVVIPKEGVIEWAQHSVNSDSHEDVNYDSQGDVLMEDLQFLSSLDDEVIDDGSFEHLSSIPSMSGHIWLGGVGNSSVDFVKELTGIARIDIEIQ